MLEKFFIKADLFGQLCKVSNSFATIGEVDLDTIRYHRVCHREYISDI